jgi:hypothetical protein
MFTDEVFQKERTQNLQNPIIKAWWNVTYA